MTDKQDTAQGEAATPVEVPNTVPKKSGLKTLFWTLVLGAAGVFFYTANEGQDNMFEDIAEMFSGAKDKVASAAGASPRSVKMGSAIVRQSLSVPESFKLQRGDKIWSGQTKSGRPAHIVLIKYTAGNRPDCQVVSFHETAQGGTKWSRTYGMQTLQDSTCRRELSPSQKAELARLFVKANGFVSN